MAIIQQCVRFIYCSLFLLLNATSVRGFTDGPRPWAKRILRGQEYERKRFSCSPSSSSALFIGVSHGKPCSHAYRSQGLSHSINGIDEKEDPHRRILSNDEISRYSRHLVLDAVGMKGQQRLKQSAVLVIGAGGLGSPCLMYLAAAGVGHIGIVDADTVDTSNLQRQIIHGTSTVGVSKAVSAAQRIHDINPFVKVKTYQEEFTSQTALRILQDGFSMDDESSAATTSTPYLVVVDGSDNFPTKYLINDACAIMGIPWVYSAILAFEGQISVFNFQHSQHQQQRLGPDYRDLLPTPPPPGDVPSCAEGGVLGVLPGTMGCLQATETLKILLGNHNDGILSGRVLIFDALQMKFSEIKLQRNSQNRPEGEITELVDYQGFCGGPSISNQQTVQVNGGRTMDEGDHADHVDKDNVSFHSIDPSDALHRLAEGWSPFVLDVRLETEHNIVALPFTDRVKPHRNVEIHDIPKSGDVLVYCKAGVRGKKACHRFMEAGVDPDRLYNLEGGIMRWQKDVDPSMPRY